MKLNMIIVSACGGSMFNRKRSPQAKSEPEWHTVMDIPKEESPIVLIWLGDTYKGTFHRIFPGWGTAWYVSIPDLMKWNALIKTNQISRWRYR